MLHSSTVIRELLQSCYTGVLQFSAKEIVNYLTAASYLQMEHVVEKCRMALSQYLQSKSGISGVSPIQSNAFGFHARSSLLRLTHLDVTCAGCKIRGVPGDGGDRQRKHSFSGRYVASS